MKGVNWSKTRKILWAIIVCSGITIIVHRGLIQVLSCTIVTTMIAAKVLPLQVFSVPKRTTRGPSG
jgi:hypothetical protein